MSLFAIFVLAKGAVLAAHPAMWNVWAPFAYFWQDALVAMIVAAVGFVFRKPRIGSTLYWLLVIYAAINVPVGRALATPLTWPMLCAARGPLADSIWSYVTWTNAAFVLLILVAAFLLQRLPRPSAMVGVVSMGVVAIFMVVAGPFAASRVETGGLDRNVVLALFSHRSSQFATTVFAANAVENSRSIADDISRLRGSAKGRNVILVSLESTAAQYLSLYGSQFETTPNLTAMANNAIVFDNTYAVYPESIKGLYSVLCSNYPALGGRSEELSGVPCRALPEALRDAGYRTALFHSGRFDYLGMESVIRNRGYQTLEDAGDIGGNHNSSFGVDEPSTVAHMLAWVDSRSSAQPFFLTYLPIAGHHPYETPERGPFDEHDDIGRYRNALHYGDKSLRALAEGLRARGLDRNTIWIIFGDHGEAFGQHAGNYGHTFFLYEENIHVPFLIVAPGLLRSTTRVSRTVSLLDVAPSILDLLGLTPIPAYQGRSVLNSETRPALFFADYSVAQLGLRDGPWKCIYEIDSGRTKLFDIPNDAGEKTNLATRRPDLAAQYAAELRRWVGL